jgi:hypothetical protein
MWIPSAAGASTQADEPITRVTVKQVRIDAVVTDSKGNLIPDLPNDDFEVFQDGKRVTGKTDKGQAYRGVEEMDFKVK